MRISAYIPSYNQISYLSEAIESVLSQSLRPTQVIIVDDCSTDGSQALIDGFSARFPGLFTTIFHSQNEGIARTRIHALEAVTGEYVSYVDGDDRLLPTKFEKEAQALLGHPNTEISYSNNFYMSKDGTRVGVWADGEKPSQGGVFGQTFARDFPRRNLFRMELVRYDAWRRVGFHDTNLRICEDWEMRIRLSRQYQVAYVDEPLSEIRLHSDGLSRLPPEEHLRAFEYIYQKHRKQLRALPQDERQCADRSFRDWIARTALQATAETIAQRNLAPGWRREALRYYVRYLKYSGARSQYTPFAQILLPGFAYGIGRVIYKGSPLGRSRSG